MNKKHKYNYRWSLADTCFTKDKGKVFSCFSGGGGSTMGYKLAGFDVPSDWDDFSRCYDLVTFCEVEKEELQKVVEAFPYYKPIIDEWDNLVTAYRDKSGVFQIIDSRRDEIMELKGYTKKANGYWVKQ